MLVKLLKKIFKPTAAPVVQPVVFSGSRSGPLAPEWFLEAKTYIGLKEVKGAKHHPTIQRWLKELNAPWTDDETAWCGTFVGAMMKRHVPSAPLPKNPFGARAWLGYGRFLDEPAVGALMVFWRGRMAGWQGHVGFYAGEDATTYHILGANQADSVNITRIPKTRLLGIRWPSGYAAPLIGRQYTKLNGPKSTNEA